MSDLSAALGVVLAEFRASTTGQQLSHPCEARGRCKPASLALLGLLRERGFSEAKLLNFVREGEEHYVAQLADLVIDRSARQFDEHADVPAVARYRDVAWEWETSIPVNFDDPWARRIHNVRNRPPEWHAAKKGLSGRIPAFEPQGAQHVMTPHTAAASGENRPPPG